MSRPHYRIDTSLTDYKRVGPMTFDFMVSPKDVGVLRNPRAVVVASRTTFRVTDLQRRPGPPVNGLQPYRFTLEKVQ